MKICNVIHVGHGFPSTHRQNSFTTKLLQEIWVGKII